MPLYVRVEATSSVTSISGNYGVAVEINILKV